ncbi:hypothetical protein MGYG_03141 [Nannizzia gypsea CBS 118893]|uniref:Uncharacterized protein n=1 Tax=Arthroderma gypseum (strain ATCC MYA-4604 / CBS 118893) TaxID=535722 RepID=E4UR20_ARTGP|nr:hypothetical protein MGYG_03141 [Nannizzia gypsea CBS 118893]EFR00135.1 hypothetical protein MGYG_03141 [Nannizzia gypsea CBS 118893]
MPLAAKSSPSNQAGTGVKLLTAEDVTIQPLIQYYSNFERHVKSNSLHKMWFTGDIEPWSNFENEVSNACSKIPWAKHPDIIAYGPPDAGFSEFHIGFRDHYACGEELSIITRWAQHALHPVSAVSKVLGFNLVFGDWKATSKKRIDFVPAVEVDSTIRDLARPKETETSINKGTGREYVLNESEDVINVRTRRSLVPDYALMVAADGAPRAVGEAKTPWNHDFPQVWREVMDIGGPEPKFLARQTLGQIGNYMIELELKYGFLTNYIHTFFLKRGVNKDGEELFYCSRPIPYDDSPMTGSKISVRQSLLFLADSARGENAWYAKKISKTNIVKRKKGESMKKVRDKLAAVTQGKKRKAAEELGRDVTAKATLEGRSSRHRVHFMDDPEVRNKKPRRLAPKRRGNLAPKIISG